VVLLLTDSEDRLIFGGVTGADGTLFREIRLPAAPEDMSLSLHAEGYESRTILISDAVEYEEISRTIAMIAEGPGTRSISGLLDSDHDGVPDVYDAYPQGSDSAFAYLVPAEGYLTVAYEDLFGLAQAGDADYNDFISHFSIEEASNDGGITSIHVEAAAAVKLAGYNHSFGIRINSFVPPAYLTINYIDEDGLPVTDSVLLDEYPNPGETSLEVVLFEHTGKAVDKVADFTLDFVFEYDGVSYNNPRDPDVLSRLPYNPYLLVINTGHDVHLIDEEPIYGSINPDDSFRDVNGFPWGLLVPPGPDGRKNPDEGARIEEPYPRFTRWRESGGELSPDWYLHSEPWEEPESVPLFFSSNRDGDFEIYSLETETGTLTQLTANGATDKHPALSTDGSKIAFVSDFEGSLGIYTMNADGTGLSGKLAGISGSFSGFSCWSPDGTLIAFSSSADGDFDIYTMKTDGSGDMSKLTDNTAVDRRPAWSPDGSHIAFSTNIDSNYEIYTIHSDGSNPVNVTNTADEDETSPTWSTNGVAYVGNGDIYSVQPESTDPPVNLTGSTVSYQDPAW